MSDSAIQLISWAFIVANAGRILAYLPQFVAAYRCEKGALAVSVLTWIYFGVAHFTGLLYAHYVVQDSSMALVFAGNFCACVALVLLVTCKRRAHRRRTRLSKFRSARFHQPHALESSL